MVLTPSLPPSPTFYSTHQSSSPVHIPTPISLGQSATKYPSGRLSFSARPPPPPALTQSSVGLRGGPTHTRQQRRRSYRAPVDTRSRVPVPWEDCDCSRPGGPDPRCVPLGVVTAQHPPNYPGCTWGAGGRRTQTRLPQALPAASVNPRLTSSRE